MVVRTKNITLMDPNLLACPDHLEVLEQLAASKSWVDINQGADARMLTQENIKALNRVKIKQIHFAWDLMAQSAAVLSGLQLYSEHGAIQDRRRRIVYVLVNYNTSMDEDLYRVYHLRELGYDPFIMVYDKPHASKGIHRLQRWVNNRAVWGSCPKFEDYLTG